MKIYDETLQQYVEVSIKALDSMPIGSIIAFAGSSIPAGWLICDGEKYAVGVNGVGTEYPDLFSVIGYTYGSYKGEDFYRVPDLKGRVPVGLDTTQTEFDTLGETGGEKYHQLTINEMPQHDHAVYMDQDGTGGRWGPNGTSQQSTLRYSVTGGTGGNQAHNNLQPYQVVNYIIKAENTTPTMASVLNTNSDSTIDTYSCDFINNMQVQAEPEIAVQSTTPTGEECLWINPEEYPDGNLNPITNTYSVAEDKGYSCNYVNNIADDVTEIGYNRYYDTTETNTGKQWIDGKTIYRTVVEFGSLPNGTQSQVKTVNHGIANIDKIVSYQAFASNTSNDQVLSLPYSYPSGAYVEYGIGIENVTKSSISVSAGTNRSAWTAVFIIEYTKTNG